MKKIYGYVDTDGELMTFYSKSHALHSARQNKNTSGAPDVFLFVPRPLPIKSPKAKK